MMSSRFNSSLHNFWSAYVFRYLLIWNRKRFFWILIPSLEENVRDRISFLKATLDKEIRNNYLIERFKGVLTQKALQIQFINWRKGRYLYRFNFRSIDIFPNLFN